MYVSYIALYILTGKKKRKVRQTARLDDANKDMQAQARGTRRLQKSRSSPKDGAWGGVADVVGNIADGARKGGREAWSNNLTGGGKFVRPDSIPEIKRIHSGTHAWEICRRVG